MLSNCGVGEDSWESLGLQGDPTSPSWRRSVLGVHWKDWCWRWNSNTLATSCEELTRWKRPWCWEGLRAGGEGDDGGWNGWMASPTRWAWVWVNSGSWWWTGRPGVLRFMGSQSRTGLSDWTELKVDFSCGYEMPPNNSQAFIPVPFTFRWGEEERKCRFLCAPLKRRRCSSTKHPVRLTPDLSDGVVAIALKPVLTQREDFLVKSWVLQVWSPDWP